MNLVSRFCFGPQLAIVHRFHRPPYGGGNQFLLALRAEMKRQGVDASANRIGRRTRACLFNSFNFDFERLMRVAKTHRNCRMIHRVDGPVGVYRGKDAGIDKEIWEINQKLAQATIFQSKYSFDKHLEIGLKFKNPVVIQNAVNPGIFNSQGRVAPPDGFRRTKLIAVSWSDNLKKGAPVYKWIEDHLDWTRYEFTFVGRSQIPFERIRMIPACSSKELARILRTHDIYITASQNEPCSNALIEALSCGLPAVFLNSGSHKALAGGAGEGFTCNEEVLMAIDLVADNWEKYHQKISMPSISEVTKRYIDVLLGNNRG